MNEKLLPALTKIVLAEEGGLKLDAIRKSTTEPTAIEVRYLDGRNLKMCETHR